MDSSMLYMCISITKIINHWILNYGMDIKRQAYEKIKWNISPYSKDPRIEDN